jgi:hypothetical protein
MGRRKGSKNKPKIYGSTPKLASESLTFIKKETVVTESIKKEKYVDDNGCLYFSICKNINAKKENKTCYNPNYFMDKLDRKCSELKKKAEEK